MTQTLPDDTIIWGHCRINGRMTASGNAGQRRLYVCERFGAVEAWVDQVKLGNFASMKAAKLAAERSVGLGE